MNSILFLSVLSVLLIGSISSSFAEIESVNVIENKLVTLLGEGIDADAEDLTFKWTQTSGESVKLSSYTVAEPTFMAPEVKNGEIKVLDFELLVTDPQGATSSAFVEIVVNPVNHPPTIDAGRDLVTFASINAMTIIPSVWDADDDVLTYKWQQISGQQTELSSTTEKYLTFLPGYLDYTKFEPLTFEVTVDDGFGGTASDSVNVYPYPGGLENKRISISAGPIQTVTEGDRVTLSATGSTLDNKPIEYSWFQLLGPSVTLSSFNGAQVEFIAPEVGDFEKLLSFQVTGYSAGNGWANALALVKVLPSNNPPVADAGDDRNVAENILVKLEGEGMDPDGDKIKYSWTQKSGKAVDLYERASYSVYFTSPFIQSESEELVFELTVTDSHGSSDTDDVSVNISSVNYPPRVNAGPDKRVHGGTQVTITGTAVDLDDDIVKLEWKQLSGESLSFDKTKATLSFTAPEVTPTTSKRIVLQLTATDSVGQIGSDQVIIFVVPENSAPTANAGPDMTVDENTIVDLTCVGTDPDTHILNYEWTSESSKVMILSSEGSKVSIKSPSVVSDETFTMTCTVSDGELASADSMNLKVRNTLSLDIIADAGMDRIVNENVKINLDGTKSNDPENQSISYEWTQVSGETVKLSSATSITPSFTSPTVANGQIKVLTFELRVYDNNGREAVDTVVITVDPINSPPEAFASATQ
ncbi:MAG: Ig-like domain-containing protein [Nitrosopumilus sp.]|nr:Ig-like domain-containing protein [Nitrosopumilus sp.]